MSQKLEIEKKDAQALLDYVTTQSVPRVSVSEVMLLIQILQSLKPIEMAGPKETKAVQEVVVANK